MSYHIIKSISIKEVVIWFSIAMFASLLAAYYGLPAMAEHDRLMNEPIVEGDLDQWRDARRRAITISGCWEWSDGRKRFIVYKLEDC